MALTIVSNIPSLFAQSTLGNTTSALDTSLQRLSSGLKINSGADGPAALVISQEQLAQIAGLQTAIQNTSKATDLVQTADGALGTINNLLTQIRGLALDSANSGVQDVTALAANQAQINNAIDTINRIASNTQFGTKKLLDGSAGISASSTDTADLTGLTATSTTTPGSYVVTTTNAGNGDQNAQKGVVSVVVGTSGAGTAFLSNTTNLGAAEALTINGPAGTAVVNLAAGETNTQVANAINAYTSQTGVVADTGAASGGLRLYTQQFGQNFSVTSSVAAGNGTTGIGTTAVNTASTASGTDFNVTAGQNAVVDITTPGGSTVTVTGNGNTVAASTGQAAGLSFTLTPSSANPFVSSTVASSTITVANGTLTFQIGANAGQTASIAINNVSASSIGIVAGNQFANLQAIDVTTTAGAQSAIAVIDKAINDVTTEAGKLGAFQTNTLQSTANNLQATLTNTQAAESTIANTDYSSEIANFTQLQVQLQAGTSVLGVANQIPQDVLSLLQKL